MRIISGKFRGKKLVEFKLKKKEDLRPTSDRNRESLFNILVNSSKLKDFGFELDGSVVFDGFCGTGAVGFEALSRGAGFVTFVDLNRSHLDIVEKNAGLFNIDDEGFEIVCANLGNGLREASRDYNLVFLDPPYKNSVIEKALLNLVYGKYIKKKTLVIVEYEKRNEIKIPKIFKSIDKRCYGKTIFEFFILN